MIPKPFKLLTESVVGYIETLNNATFNLSFKLRLHNHRGKLGKIR